MPASFGRWCGWMQPPGRANPVRSFQNCTPNWFPDSQHIVFSSRPAGQQDAYGSTQLWMARSDGTEARLVYGEDGRHIYGGALSPDGRYVIFSNFPADGDWYRTPRCAPMYLMRLAETPAIGGESPDLRSRHANTKDGPRLPLADGWLPNWTYADIPTAESIEIGERREPLRNVAVRDVAAAFDRQRKRPIGFEGSGTLGAVGAGDARGVAAGLASLECGGNAADAAACVLLTECVSDYGFLAIGAEASLMSYNVERRQTRTFAGLGGAPLDPKAIAWYYENGIPADGHVKAAPTPGIVSLLVTTLQEEGSMSFEEIAAPVLVLLDEGKETWHPNLAKTVRRLIDAEQRAAGGRIAKLQAVHDRFYKGDIAEELAAYYEHQGSFLRKADLAAHRTQVEDPVSVDYRGYTVVKCGPWTQGPCLCQALKLLEGFDLPAMGHLSVDYTHVVAEAIKLAMADRDEYYGDPRFVPVPLRQLLSADYATIRRPLINMARASTEFRPGDPIHLRPLKGPGTPEPGPKGTTTCVVADRWGNVVAATPSGNGPYAVCQELGIAHGNRLRSLNTRRGHPNCLEPGKRPRITLTPTLVFKDGKPIGAVSVAGGDQQDQTTLNVLLNLVHFGMTPAQAVSAPRFASSHHENSFKPYPDRTRARVGTATLTVQTNLPPEVCHQLAQRGHKLEKIPPPIAMPSLLWIDPVTRVISVAGDSHAGRHAAALSAP